MRATWVDAAALFHICACCLSLLVTAAEIPSVEWQRHLLRCGGINQVLIVGCSLAAINAVVACGIGVLT